ncbi:unnamed protein product, partial [Laminaria digitata]
GREDGVSLSSSGLRKPRPQEDKSCPNCGGDGWPHPDPHAAANPADRGPCQICLSSPRGRDHLSGGLGMDARIRPGSVDGGAGDGPQLIPDSAGCSPDGASGGADSSGVSQPPPAEVARPESEVALASQCVGRASGTGKGPAVATADRDPDAGSSSLSDLKSRSKEDGSCPNCRGKGKGWPDRDLRATAGTADCGHCEECRSSSRGSNQHVRAG